MALKATIFKASLNLADMDRQIYGDFPLTLARHPSETDQRMMLRILLFAMHASEQLEFTRGLSTQDEPDLWQKSLSGEIELWIDLGLPEESRIRKACGRARKVLIAAYGDRAAPVWWQRIEKEVSRFRNLEIIEIREDSLTALAGLCERSMDLQCTIQDGQIWVSDTGHNVEITPVRLYPHG